MVLAGSGYMSPNTSGLAGKPCGNLTRWSGSVSSTGKPAAARRFDHNRADRIRLSGLSPERSLLLNKHFPICN
jgi:hypothetical protein